MSSLSPTVSQILDFCSFLFREVPKFSNPACAASARATPTALVAKRYAGVHPCGPAPRLSGPFKKHYRQCPSSIFALHKHKTVSALVDWQNKHTTDFPESQRNIERESPLYRENTLYTEKIHSMLTHVSSIREKLELEKYVYNECHFSI